MQKLKKFKICNLQTAICKSSAGFTILELTISISLIGLIVLIMVGAMRLGSRSIDSGEKKIESLERTRSSLSILDSQIQSQIPLTYDDEGTKKYYFIGERELLQFATNYSIWGGEKGYVIVTYKIGSDNSGKQALYASENIIGLNNNREAKLSNTFDTIYFEYFYKDPTEEEGKWIEQWTDDGNIPEKVRIHLIEGTKDLSMIIPMRVSGSLSQGTSSSGSARKFVGPFEGQ